MELFVTAIFEDSEAESSENSEPVLAMANGLDAGLEIDGSENGDIPGSFLWGLTLLWIVTFNK